MNSRIYFTAISPNNGTELWRTDGTNAGTRILKQINNGAFASYPAILAVIGNTLYFAATGTGDGRELWRSNGTAATTEVIAPIIGEEGRNPGSACVVGNDLYFSAETSVGRELCRSNGTSIVKIKDIQDGSSMPAYFTKIGTLTYFAADDGVNGMEIWRTNGVITTMLRDICVGIGSSYPSDFQVVISGGTSTLYFAATDQNGDRELWKVSGSSAVRVKDIRTNGSSNPSGLTAYNGKLYFSAMSNTDGAELYVSDGTEAGTIKLKDINPGSTGSVPRYFTVSGSNLYFSAFSATGEELWKTNGTSLGTVQVKDIRSGAAHSSPMQLINVEGKLYFTANDGVNGRELWKSEGTSATTVMVRNLHPTGDAGISQMTNFNGTLYFKAENGTSLGRQIFLSNGTSAGTVSVLANTNNDAMAVTGNALYITHDGPNGKGRELYKLTTAAPTPAMLKDINTGASSSNPKSFKVAGNRLYFLAYTEEKGYELYTSDGSEAGTYLISDLRPGVVGSNILNMEVCVNELYFSANNGGNGQEPYRMSIPAAKPDEVEDREAVRPEATVQTPTAAPEIKVYPNPAVDYVRVDLPENAPVGTLAIFDANGRQIREVTPAEGDTYAEISLQEYTNGIYWVRWMQKDATPVTKKLTVQH